MGWGGRWEQGSGWGTHVNPWLIHVNVWQKKVQYCKVISLQLIKINEKKAKKKKKKTEKKKKLNPYLTLLKKCISKWIKDLNVRPENCKTHGRKHRGKATCHWSLQ